MSEIKILTMHNTSWPKPMEIVELDDVILNKLSVKGKYTFKYDLIDYTINTILLYRYYIDYTI